MPKLKKEKIIHLDIEELTEKSHTKEKVSDVSLGNILENARKKKKLEIDEISELLRIKSIYLEALEKGHYYVFPARSYAIGFLRNYAKFLKLNPDELVELFHQETSNTQEEPLDMLVLEKKFPLPSPKTVFKILGFVVVLYVIWYLIAIYLYPETPILKENLGSPVPPVIEEVASLEPETVSQKPEIKEEEPKGVPELKEISDDVFMAPVAFVAFNRVWVSIKDIKNNKVLIDKTFVKNEHFIPEVPLADLVISTGKGDSLDLYLDGKRVKTFSKEENTPLAGLETKN